MTRSRKSFTLIEMIIVISIISILVAITVISMRAAQVKDRDSKRMEDINTINTALQNYGLLDNHQYPYSGCTGSTNTVLDSNFKSVLTPQYLHDMPTDPSTPTSTYDNEQYVYLSTDSASKIVDFTSCTVNQIEIGARDYYLFAFLETSSSPLSNSAGILSGINTNNNGAYITGPFGPSSLYNLSDPRGINNPSQLKVNNAYVVRTVGQ